MAESSELPAAPEAGPVRPGWGAAIEAFRYRDYSIFWVGALVSNTGGWMQTATLPYVILQITDSPAWVGFSGFAQLIPMVVSSPLGGWLADRFSRRSVLMVTQSAMAVVALALWLLWVGGVRAPLALIAVAALSGFLQGLNLPSWQAFISELVPRHVLLNAVTLNSTQFNAGRALGPAAGGLVLATLGPGWSFLLNAVSFGAVLCALAVVRPVSMARGVAAAGDRPRLIRQIGETFRYVRSVPGIAACEQVIAGVALLGSTSVAMTAVFADDVFGVGTLAYGWLSAAQGIGAILGAPLIAGWGGSVSRYRLITGSALFFCGCVLLFGLAPAYAVAFVALLGFGAGYLAIASTLNTTIQLLVDEEMRGRVLAFHIMVLTASAPIGSLTMGGLAQLVGPRAAVVLPGTFVLGWILLLIGSGRLRAMADADDRGGGPVLGANGSGERDGSRPDRTAPA